MEPKKTRPWYKFNKISLQSVDRQSKKVEVATARHAKKFLLGRLENLQYIRRHLIGWLALLIMLIGLNALQIVFDQRSVSIEYPAKDSAYAEGVMGPINNLNPFFASTDAEISAGKLIFSSLLSYDTNGRLQGEVAEIYKIDASGKVYTVNIRPDVKWHDGKPLTADDIVFTINAMKNPATGSRHYSSWQSIEAVASGPYQV
ncbi:MAG: ABC transporter substrate-binding protein, partial [Patescibacteria group bacterium]